MILGNKEIRQRAQQEDLVKPFNLANLQPASYDIRLAGPFIYTPPVDKKIIFGSTMPKSNQGNPDFLILVPGAFVLGSTVEWVNMPLDLSAQVDGRSTLGRLGVALHITAGWIDPGFKGHITLEICNHSRQTIAIPQGARVGQLIFFPVLGCDCGYDGKYQGQISTTNARNDSGF
jgi:dCTP deaminase